MSCHIVALSDALHVFWLCQCLGGIEWNLFIIIQSSPLGYCYNRGGLLILVTLPGHNQLAVIQRWSAYTVEPVYSGHPWDITSWLLYRGGLFIQWNLYIVVTLPGHNQVGCYTELACLYSGTCILQWSPLEHNQLAVIQSWPVYTVEPVYYSGHPWDTTSWLSTQRWPAYTVEPVYSSRIQYYETYLYLPPTILEVTLLSLFNGTCISWSDTLWDRTS